MKSTCLALLTFLLLGLPSCTNDDTLEWKVGEEGMDVSRSFNSSGATEMTLKVTSESYCIIASGIELTVKSGNINLKTEIIQILPYEEVITIPSNATIDIRTKVVDLNNENSCKRLGNTNVTVHY